MVTRTADGKRAKAEERGHRLKLTCSGVVKLCRSPTTSTKPTDRPSFWRDGGRDGGTAAVYCRQCRSAAAAHECNLPFAGRRECKTASMFSAISKRNEGGRSMPDNLKPRESIGSISLTWSHCIIGRQWREDGVDGNASHDRHDQAASVL